MIRLQNGQLARILHQQLYQRMLNFAEKYSPELTAEPIINGWINRLYNDDPTMHIIINFDESTLKITEHAVIDIQEAYGMRIVVGHQTQIDKPNIAILDEVMEYMGKLAEAINASSIIFFTEQHSKSFQRRYGYSIARTMMVKSIDR